MEISEKAPAKLNISLDTPYRHPSGDPEWDMVMTSIDLADYVTITSTDSSSDQITVETNSGFLPCDQRNLAFQAAATLKNKFNIHQKVAIKIQKNIPVAAGMGGGSSDAAAVLRGLNRLWHLGLSTKELAQIGLQIDSDVPFCVYSQTARVTGRGEVITPLLPLPPMWLVIAKIRASVSTHRILRQINYKKIDHQDVDAVVDAIQHNDLDGLCASMGNSLEKITCIKHPQILKIKNAMLKSGAIAAQMSGTGPTVFGICPKRTQAQHVYNSLKGFCKDVYIVRPLHIRSDHE